MTARALRSSGRALFAALVALALTVTATGPVRAAPHAPLQRHRGTVLAGPVRIQVLTATLLRLEYAADGHFTDAPTFNAVDRHFTPPPFHARRVDGDLVVRTSRLTLRYREGSGPFSPTNTALTLSVGGHPSVVHPAFGSPAHQDSLGGWYRGLDYYPDQAGPVDDLTLHQGLLDRSGWYLLDDTTTALRTDDDWVRPRPAHQGAYQDGYLFGYGHDYRRALRDLTTLTGPSPLLPKWALGLWFSKYQAYSFDDYRTSLLPAFRRHGVPLDALVADTDWKSPNQWAGWNWNSDLFPDPAAFLAWAKSQHLATTLNVHAAISADDPRYPQAQRIAGGALQPADSSFAPDAHQFDWSARKQADAYFWLHQPFEQQGVRQWWLDYCCDSSGVSMPGLTPDSWINELYRRDGDRRGLRGFSLARLGASFPDYTATPAAGPWGEHRSTVHFTGDTRADWDTLAFEAAFTQAEGAAIGEPYVSHDIGSFAGKHLPDDLYLRWLQLGTFQPVDRLHSDHGDRLPWEYGDAVRGAAEKFLRLRDAMAPYLYTLSRQAHDTGLPMARALYLTWPEADGAYRNDAEYTLGDQLLVAPVTTPGLTATTDVWFPPGTWTDIFTGTTYRGPATHSVVSTPDRMPVFARGGGILPLAPAADSIATQPQDQLTLKVFPHGPGSFRLYDDAGEGSGYRHGEHASTPVRYRERGSGATLRIGPTRGHYQGQPAARTYTARFVDVARPHHVTVDGRRSGFRYDAASRTLTVTVPRVSRHRPVVVRHDGAPLAVAPQPPVGFTLTAPDGMQAGTASKVVGTVHDAGPGAVRDVRVDLPQPEGWTVTPTSPTSTDRLTAGSDFRVTFQVTPPGDASFQQLVGHARYRNPDGTAASLPAEVQVAPRPVDVTFRMRAPAETPPDATVYLPGNIDQLGPWDPGKVAMTDEGDGIWEATVSILEGTQVQYKYTRGSWDTVEWWGDITGTVNRSVTVHGGLSGTMLVDDTSTDWSDSSVPDEQKAVRHWRDPLVSATAPAAGSTGPSPDAVTVRFARDVAPSGADFDGSVVVTRGDATVAGTVAESSPGVLTFTPDDPLPAGTYQVTVSGVASALGSDGVPMQQPYRFDFTVS